ncbi:hypothetical protein IJT93_02350 [bacterium]|nr:hypothetical protein [bacterium]
MEDVQALIEKEFKSGCPELWGHGRCPGLVHVDYAEGSVLKWKRLNGRAVCEKADFRPYLWANSQALADGADLKAERRSLEGAGYFDCLLSCSDAAELAELSRRLAELTGIKAGSLNSGQMYVSDAVSLYLMQSGETMYEGMAFEDIVRADIAVCTAGGNIENLRFYADEPAEVIEISLPDKNISLSVKDFASEAQLLQSFVEAVREADPDIILGHGLYDDILPYLKARGKACRVKLMLGRRAEGLRPKEAQSRRTYMQIAGKRYDYLSWEIQGRDAADTLFLARLRDVSVRELETFDLREVAESLNVSFGDAGGETDAAEPAAKVRRYCAALRRSADILLYPFFLQAQFAPYSLQNTILRGSATKINALFLREYLHRGYAVPERPDNAAYMGAAVGSEVSGLVHDVLHCDVQSLYPSIIISFGLGPQGDSLNVFLDMLAKLREFRLKAKDLKRREMKGAGDPVRINFYETLQTAFKILINSFYGYLGFGQGNFADFERAAQVTAKGREILEFLVDKIKASGCTVIEYDTDGVYFTGRPELMDSESERETFVKGLNASLPEGIEVDLDGRYKAMYSHTSKNYALADFAGNVSFAGATFRSRTRENYLRSILQKITSLVLNGRGDEAAGCIAELKEDLSAHRTPIEDLLKTEILNDSTENYLRKKQASGRSRSAAYEVALRLGRSLQAGQKVQYYITGTKKNVKLFESAKDVSEYDPAHPDENSAYYIGKLEALLDQFPLLLGK